MSDLREIEWRVSRPAIASWVGWRAERIGDPVERLRFLRHSSFWWRSPARDRRSWTIPPLAGVLIVLTVLPIPTISDSPGDVRQEPQQVVIPGEEPTSKVWQVESTDSYEIYSNGLRIEKAHTLPAGEQVQFVRYGLLTDLPQESTRPYGIVYHTTESHTLPFDETQNRALRRAGQGVLRYVRSIRAYHYVIDRFGRVWRIVPDNEAADHAGNSVWSNDNAYYMNLNRSFLAVSFEGRSRDESGRAPVTEPQIHAGKLLTQMLRSRDGIPARNCVTHAQVSVNPINMGMGYHTDWAADFPFEQIGLHDNYRIPPPAMLLFGFESDPVFRAATGERLWRGLDAAETELFRIALAEGITIGELRRKLRLRYRTLYARLKVIDQAQEGR